MDNRSRKLRRLVVRAMEQGGRGHLGSALSLIEILRVLFDDFLRFRPDEPEWALRDRFILSKGHGCLALYSILADKGFLPVEELDTFCSHDSRLGGHPERGKVPSVEASTGALGHGLGIGVGLALAARLQGRDTRTIVVMGDGEINEGAVWESAMCASKHRLRSLTAIVDYNKLQSYGTTYEVQDLEPLVQKWESFGFAVTEVDGHNVASLRRVFRELPFDPERPSAVICHTVKGKGIGEAENNAHWHHKSRVEPDVIAKFYRELEDR